MKTTKKPPLTAGHKWKMKMGRAVERYARAQAEMTWIGNRDADAHDEICREYREAENQLRALLDQTSGLLDAAVVAARS